MDKGRFLAEGSLGSLLSADEYALMSLTSLLPGPLPDDLPQKSAGPAIEWDRANGRGRCEMHNVSAELPHCLPSWKSMDLRLIRL